MGSFAVGIKNRIFPKTVAGGNCIKNALFPGIQASLDGENKQVDGDWPRQSSTLSGF
jgi:hypothetical protein